MGITYERRIPRLPKSASLPSAAQTAYNNMVNSFKFADRGHVRAGNDNTLETRAKAFADWLGELGFHDKSLSAWDANTAIAMISAWVLHVAQNGGVKQSKKPLSAQTLNGYAKAAECWCSTILQLDLRNALNSTGLLHPFIQEVITQRRAWQKPRLKKEPITLAMFENAQIYVATQVKADRSAFLARPAAVHNFICLGAFTGSRIGEYGQTKARRGLVQRIPNSADAGEWASMPLAFIRADFTFWDKEGNELEKSDLKRTARLAKEVYIRFRYDKSLNNFTIRKFRRTGHKFLCPVIASISILVRANYLNVPATEPVGVFRPHKETPTGFTYLTNSDVTDELRSTCLRTYPDKNHYLHKNHKQIMAHSVRVTAAVALHTAGQSFDTIAFRLRWSAQSVQHYIRDCSQHVGDLCNAVLVGAGRV